MKYKIYTLNRNDIPFYVGCTTLSLKDRHKSNKCERQDNSFVTELLEETNDPKDEIYWIQQHQCWGFELENKELIIGYRHADEHKKKISDALIGRIITKQHALNISKALKGIKRGPMSDEHKLKHKISGLKARGTKEQRELTSKRSIERYKDPEQRELSRKITLERYKDPEERKKHSLRMKKWWAERR